MTERTFHVDGKLVPESEATVSIRDRGFLYGDGVFETLRVYDGDVFEWEAHADRLARSLATLDFEETMPPVADLRERVLDTVDANDFADAYARLSMTRGVQPGTLTPEPRVDPTITVVVSELPRGGTEGEAVWEGPADLRAVETRRIPSEALPADAKTHNYLNGILARLDLGDSGADEAIMLDADGHVTEGATSNLFFVDGGQLKTPSTELDVLPGITRNVVLDLAREEGFPVETGQYTVETVREADEVFVTNTTWEIRPVTSVDGRDIERGPMTTLLGKLFDEYVEATHY
jgi:branched-chain amino acid aminotransferase